VVHLDAGPKLADGKFRPGRHLEGWHLWPQQVLLRLASQLLEEREGAGLLGGQKDVHYTGCQLAESDLRTTLKNWYKSLLPLYRSMISCYVFKSIIK
jgi:hypothetical protein